MIAGLLVATTLAAVDPSVERDLRCVGAFMIAAGQNEKMSADEQSGVTGAMMFYVGRIEGRQPGFPLQDSLIALLNRPDYLDSLVDDAQRCGTEMEAKGRELESLGTAMQRGDEGAAPAK